MTVLAKVFYLWVEMESIFRPAGIIADSAELLYVSEYK
jgi:hypothetical protein